MPLTPSADGPYLEAAIDDGAAAGQPDRAGQLHRRRARISASTSPSPSTRWPRRRRPSTARRGWRWTCPTTPAACWRCCASGAISVKEMVGRGGLTEVWVPALQAKDLALALELHAREFPDRATPAGEPRRPRRRGGGVPAGRRRRPGRTRRSGPRLGHAGGGGDGHRDAVPGPPMRPPCASPCRALAAAAVVVWAAVAWQTAPGEAHKSITSKYLYNEDVFPVFQAHCGRCHVEGGVAPMSLMTYDDAFPWAESLRIELLNETIPAWHPLKLTARELDLVLVWATGGAPRGKTENAPPPVTLPTDWPSGAPDLALPMPAPFTLEASAERGHARRRAAAGPGRRPHAAGGRSEAGHAGHRAQRDAAAEGGAGAREGAGQLGARPGRRRGADAAAAASPPARRWSRASTTSAPGSTRVRR